MAAPAANAGPEAGTEGGTAAAAAHAEPETGPDAGTAAAAAHAEPAEAGWYAMATSSTGQLEPRFCETEQFGLSGGEDSHCTQRRDPPHRDASL